MFESILITLLKIKYVFHISYIIKKSRFKNNKTKENPWFCRFLLLTTGCKSRCFMVLPFSRDNRIVGQNGVNLGIKNNDMFIQCKITIITLSLYHILNYSQ